MQDVANGWVWLGFSIFLIFALSIDTIFLNKKFARPHQSMRASIVWTIVWVTAALIFNVLLWFYLYCTRDIAIANRVSLDFLTGYIIEKSLSVDNLFVFYMIFKQLRIPVASQQRVLSYGIWGAIIMRLVLILLGTWLVRQFHWVLYLMGAFLLYTGIKMFLIEDKEEVIAETWIARILKRFIRMKDTLHGELFFVVENAKVYATPLFLAVIFVEFSDLVFAFDSIPAIFAITQDPFIVWSSNIFAILGLRALYFLLAGVATRFHLLKYGIALILVYVGAKMVLAPWVSIPVGVSLAVIVVILTLFTWLSFAQEKRQGR